MTDTHRYLITIPLPYIAQKEKKYGITCRATVNNAQWCTGAGLRWHVKCPGEACQSKWVGRGAQSRVQSPINDLCSATLLHPHGRWACLAIPIPCPGWASFTACGVLLFLAVRFSSCLLHFHPVNPLAIRFAVFSRRFLCFLPCYHFQSLAKYPFFLLSSTIFSLSIRRLSLLDRRSRFLHFGYSILTQRLLHDSSLSEAKKLLYFFVAIHHHHRRYASHYFALETGHGHVLFRLHRGCLQNPWCRRSGCPCR